MTTAIIANLEKLINGPRDGALLRYSLGNEWLKAGEAEKAAACLRAAIERDAHYTAAWKLLGKALAESGDLSAAQEAYGQGLSVAEARGDIQAAKEMRVFLRRLDKAVKDPTGDEQAEVVRRGTPEAADKPAGGNGND